MEHGLAWFVEVAPKVITWCATFLVGALGKRLLPYLLDRVTKRWLKDAAEIDRMAERDEEEKAAAEAFTAEARAILEDANRQLAKERDEALADATRLAALVGQYERLARERGEALDAAMSGHTPVVRPPRSDPPDVVELDDRTTDRPPAAPPTLPPLRRPLPPRTKP